MPPINKPRHDAAHAGEDFSRRSFLYSLGALALGGCGVGADDAGAPATRLLAASGTGGFAHPGLLHTQDDFARMALNLNIEPWKSTWNVLINNSHAKLSYTPAAVPIVYRGFDGVNAENYARLFNDVAAAYACAVRWKLSGDVAYADKAVQIMNAWSGTLKSISGNNDMYLAAGIYGYEFANAGEIMRTYSGWAAADFARFQQMMRTIFYPMNHTMLSTQLGKDVTHINANWDVCNMASVMAIGVLCDEQALFDEAITYFKSGAGNGAIAQGVYYVHPGHLGQWQESGRDQAHTVLGVALMGAVCEMAWNQGVDLYGYDNNRFLMMAEYIAKSNLIEFGTTYYTVPFVRYSNVLKLNHTVLSKDFQGTIRPCWALVMNHYVNRKGLAAPWSSRFARQISPEGGGGNYGPNSGGYDQLGYGTLTHARTPAAPAATPSGLAAHVSAGTVVLSWWGCAGAGSYSVQRAPAAEGPYTTIASGISDLLTYTDSGMSDGAWFYTVTADTPAGAGPASAPATAITGVRLHTHLAFDEGSAMTAADASGNSHAATLAAGASWASGKTGSALALNGSSAYVELPADIMSDVGDFTISAWVYWNAARTWDRVFDFGSSSSRYMMLTARGANGFARFAMTVSGRDGEVFVDSNAALPRSQWFHVAVSLSGRVCTLYVNGVAVGSNNDMFFAPFRLQSTSRNWIGRSQNGTQPYFNGRIDDFRIYRGAISGSDLVLMMNGQQRYVDLGASVTLTQLGAVLNRSTQKYVGGVTITNSAGPLLKGSYRLTLHGLSSGITLDNASGVDAGSVYIDVAAQLAPGAKLTVPLTFSNPARSLISFTPRIYRSAF